MTEPARKSMYSPAQVRAAAFVGGPLAGSHLLWSNFHALGKVREARWAATVGIALTGFLVAVGFAMNAPARSTIIIPLLIAFAYSAVADIYQLKKSQITASDEFIFQSNWKVTGISVMWLLIIFATLFVLVFLWLMVHPCSGDECL